MPNPDFNISIVTDRASVAALRKTISDSLSDLGVNASEKSISAITKKIQTSVKPRISIGVDPASFNGIGPKIARAIGVVNVKASVDPRSLEELKQTVRQSLGRVSIDIKSTQIRRLKDVIDDTAKSFDRISAAKDRFAANVDQKFPKIIDQIKKLNSELGNTSNNINTQSSAVVQQARQRRPRQATSVIETTAAGQDKLGGTTDKTTQAIKDQGNAVKETTNHFRNFAERIGFTTARLSAYIIAGSGIFALISGFNKARESIIDTNTDLNKLTQILEGNAAQASDVADKVLAFGAAYGQSGKELLKVTNIVAQIGGEFQNTDVLTRTVKDLSRTNLAATFGSIEDTTQGLTASLGQFNLKADETNSILSLADRLSKKFAFESSDLFSAVKTGGASFALAGGNIKEFAATVVSLRQTTRQSTSTIAAGLNTIALKSLTPENIRFVDELTGGKIRNADGTLKGLVDRWRELAKATKGYTDEELEPVIEKLAGIRQGKVFAPLLRDLQKGGNAFLEQALQEADKHVGELNRDAAIGLERIDVQLAKVGARFEQIFKGLAEDKGVKQLVKDFVTLAHVAATAFETIAPLLPILIRIGAIKLAFSGFGLLKNIFSGTGKALESGGSRILPGDKKRTIAFGGSVPIATDRTRRIDAEIAETSKQMGIVADTIEKQLAENKNTTKAVTEITRPSTGLARNVSPIKNIRDIKDLINPLGASSLLRPREGPIPFVQGPQNLTERQIGERTNEFFRSFLALPGSPKQFGVSPQGQFTEQVPTIATVKRVLDTVSLKPTQRLGGSLGGFGGPEARALHKDTVDFMKKVIPTIPIAKPRTVAGINVPDEQLFLGNQDFLKDQERVRAQGVAEIKRRSKAGFFERSFSDITTTPRTAEQLASEKARQPRQLSGRQLLEHQLFDIGAEQRNLVSNLKKLNTQYKAVSKSIGPENYKQVSDELKPLASSIRDARNQLNTLQKEATNVKSELLNNPNAQIIGPLQSTRGQRFRGRAANIGAGIGRGLASVAPDLIPFLGAIAFSQIGSNETPSPFINPQGGVVSAGALQAGLAQRRRIFAANQAGQTGSLFAGAGGLAGAAIGQALIPIPGVGAAIGAGVGTLVAGGAGAGIGSVRGRAAGKQQGIQDLLGAISQTTRATDPRTGKLANAFASSAGAIGQLTEEIKSQQGFRRIRNSRGQVVDIGSVKNTSIPIPGIGNFEVGFNKTAFSNNFAIGLSALGIHKDLQGPPTLASGLRAQFGTEEGQAALQNFRERAIEEAKQIRGATPGQVSGLVRERLLNQLQESIIDEGKSRGKVISSSEALIKAQAYVQTAFSELNGTSGLLDQSLKDANDETTKSARAFDLLRQSLLTAKDSISAFIDAFDEVNKNITTGASGRNVNTQFQSQLFSGIIGKGPLGAFQIPEEFIRVAADKLSQAIKNPTGPGTERQNIQSAIGRVSGRFLNEKESNIIGDIGLITNSFRRIGSVVQSGLAGQNFNAVQDKTVLGRAIGDIIEDSFKKNPLDLQTEAGRNELNLIKDRLVKLAESNPEAFRENPEKVLQSVFQEFDAGKLNFERLNASTSDLNSKFAELAAQQDRFREAQGKLLELQQQVFTSRLGRAQLGTTLGANDRSIGFAIRGLIKTQFSGVNSPFVTNVLGQSRLQAAASNLGQAQTGAAQFLNTFGQLKEGLSPEELNQAQDAQQKLISAQQAYDQELQNSQNQISAFRAALENTTKQVNELVNAQKQLGTQGIGDINNNRFQFRQFQALTGNILEDLAKKGVTSTEQLGKLSPAEQEEFAKRFRNIAGSETFLRSQKGAEAFSGFINPRTGASIGAGLGLSQFFAGSAIARSIGLGGTNDRLNGLFQDQNSFFKTLQVLEEKELGSLDILNQSVLKVAEAVIRTSSLPRSDQDRQIAGLRATANQTTNLTNTPVVPTQQGGTVIPTPINVGGRSRKSQLQAAEDAIGDLLEKVPNPKDNKAKDAVAQLYDVLDDFSKQIRAQPNAKTSADLNIKSDININGFDAVGKDQATAAIVISIMGEFVKQLDRSNAGEAALADKLNNAMKLIESSQDKNKP